MATIIIRSVVIGETHFTLHIEFDFSLVEGGNAETIHIAVSKPEYLFWKETADPAKNAITDYIQTLVQPKYEKLLKQRDLADTLNLVDKEITWT